MLTARPQTRFLLRGSMLLIGMLALWWLALQTPMLFTLRLSEEIALRLLRGADRTDPIVANPSGDWTFRVPVEDIPPEFPQNTGAVKMHSIEFTMSRSDVLLFTFSVPFYWAIALAAPARGSWLRVLVWGTGLVAIVEVLSLLAFVEISAHAVVAPWHPAAGGLTRWSRELADYLLVNVIPFFAPLLIAVALHRDLRSQVFPWAVSKPQPAGGRPDSHPKPRSKRRSARKSTTA